MTPGRRALLGATAAVALVALGAAGVEAQGEGCATPAPIEARVADAPVAFVGTVTALADADRDATVDVIRVWRGGALPTRVRVRGTVATQAKVHTALDRTYAQGATYLFLPTAGSSPSFIEDRCSGTAVLTSELAALAPPGGGVPPTRSTVAAEEQEGRGLAKALPLGVGIVVGAAIVTALLLARRSDRRRRALPGGPQSP